MAIESYFFNAVESGGVYDRVYNSEDFCNTCGTDAFSFKRYWAILRTFFTCEAAFLTVPSTSNASSI